MRIIALFGQGRRRAAERVRVVRSTAGHHQQGVTGVAGLLLIVVVVGLAAASCGGSAARPVGSLQVRPCTVQDRPARCGTLIVPEDRLTGRGRTISVRFVVIPALGPGRRAPDPVVWFAGGPGDSAVNNIPSELAALDSLNIHRDLVFIDQRGTGGSNPLTCPAFRGDHADKGALRTSVESCLAHLRGDLRFYTTAMFADDVNQVLGALHYAKVNLMGISYGPIAEQVFLLRHPARVRTMTLISGLPLDVPLWERSPGNAQRALEYVFTLCERDAACHRAFPHLAADWASLWASLGRSPWVVPAARSPDGKMHQVDQYWLAAGVHELLYTGNIGVIPVLVHTLAAAKDKIAALLALHSAFSAPPGSSVNQVMRYAIMCSEPWARWRPQALSGQRASFYYRTALQDAQWWQYVCSFIPKSSAAVGQQRLTVSHVPVLAFNGEADPQDPPGVMAGIGRSWPNSRALALPGQGHNRDTSSWAVCADALTKTFIEQASVAHLDTSCLAKVPAPPFALTLQQAAAGG